MDSTSSNDEMPKLARFRRDTGPPPIGRSVVSATVCIHFGYSADGRTDCGAT